MLTKLSTSATDWSMVSSTDRGISQSLVTEVENLASGSNPNTFPVLFRPMFSSGLAVLERGSDLDAVLLHNPLNYLPGSKQSKLSSFVRPGQQELMRALVRL